MSDRDKDKKPAAVDHGQEEEKVEEAPTKKKAPPVEQAQPAPLKKAPSAAAAAIPDEDWKGQLREELSSLPQPVRTAGGIDIPPPAAARYEYDDRGRITKGSAAGPPASTRFDSRGRPSKNRVSTEVDGRVGAHALSSPAPRRNRQQPGGSAAVPSQQRVDAYVVDAAAAVDPEAPNPNGSPQNNNNNVTTIELTTTRDENKLPWWKSEVFLVAMGSFVLVAIAVAVIVPLVLRMGDDKDNSMDNNKPALNYQDKPTEAPFDVTTLVPNLPESTRAAFNDTDSYQYQAALFLSKDPKWDTYEDWRKTQRFAMAVLAQSFHTMGYGGRSDASGYFLDQSDRLDDHECKWELQFPMCPEGDGVIRGMGKQPYTGDRQKSVFPPELALLSHLEKMDFFRVELLQPLEEMFTVEAFLSLPNISYFAIRDSDLMPGGIPTTFGLLTKLTHLDLSDNKLTSSIPSELGLLSNLRTLILFENDFSGTIPPEILNLTNLEELKMERNNNNIFD